MGSGFSPCRVVAVCGLGADDAATLDRAGGITQVSAAALLVVITTKLEGAEVPPADVTTLGKVIPDQAPHIGIEMLETAYRQEADAARLAWMSWVCAGRLCGVRRTLRRSSRSPVTGPPT